MVMCEPIPIHRFEEEIPKLVPDYTTLDQWLAHPMKFDNSITSQELIG